MIPQTMPNDDATSPCCPHAERTPSSSHHCHITTEWKQQEVGMAGKDRGGERMWRDGGQGATTRYVIVPWSSWQQWGGRMAHMCLLLPTPSCSRSIVDEGQCESHMLPPIWLRLPLLWGVFFSMSWMMMGVACRLHTASFHFFFIPPCWGVLFFSSVMGIEAACDPHNVSVSLHLPPTVGGGFFPLYKYVVLFQYIQFNTILIVL